jgi:transcriptional regulator with XRE-family HTH domain
MIGGVAWLVDQAVERHTERGGQTHQEVTPRGCAPALDLVKRDWLDPDTTGEVSLFQIGALASLANPLSEHMQLEHIPDAKLVSIGATALLAYAGSPYCLHMPATYRKRRVVARKRVRRDKDLDQAIARRVAELRIKNQMSQVELGRFLGRQDAATAAHKLETAKTGFSISDLIALADKFGVTLDKLIRGFDPESDESLTDAEIDTVMRQYAATDAERAEFTAHRKLYRDHRITTSYLMVFLLVLRRDRNVAQAADAAVNAAARDAAVAESGSTTRVPPGELRRRRKT